MNSNSVETENLKDTIRRLQRIIELRNEEIKILEEQLEDKMLENQMLRNSNSKSLYDSVCSKLENVSQRLSLTEEVLRSNKRMLQDAIIERDKMRKLIEEFVDCYDMKSEWNDWNSQT